MSGSPHHVDERADAQTLHEPETDPVPTDPTQSPMAPAGWTMVAAPADSGPWAKARRPLIAAVLALLVVAFGAFALSSRSTGESATPLRTLTLNELLGDDRASDEEALVDDTTAEETLAEEALPDEVLSNEVIPGEAPLDEAVPDEVSSVTIQAEPTPDVPVSPPLAPADAADTTEPVDPTNPVDTSGDPDDASAERGDVTAGRGDDAVEPSEPAPTPIPEPTEAPELPSMIGATFAFSGAPLPGVGVELFATGEDFETAALVESTLTDERGRFGLTAPDGCYVLTFIPPPRTIIVGGGNQGGVPFCVGEFSPPVVFEAIFDAAPIVDSQVGGIVRRAEIGVSVPGVNVEIFKAEGESFRGELLASVQTLSDGTYRFNVPEGCYFVSISALPDSIVVGGAQVLFSPQLCVEPQTPGRFDAQLAKPPSG